MHIKKPDTMLTVAEASSGIFPFKLNVCLYIAGGVMIDAGSSLILGETISLVRKERIDCVAVTHVHEDHTGAAEWIKENLGVPVYLHSGSIAEAALKSDVPLYRRLVWGNRQGFRADPLPQYIETERIRLDVIDAPGHHPNHVVFHEKKMGWLFTGDLYVSRKQAVAFKDENISDAIASIRKLLGLDFGTIFCGHSGVQENGKEKLKAKLDFYLEFQSTVKELANMGLTPEEINRRLFPRKNLWELVSRGEWSSLNMVRTV